MAGLFCRCIPRKASLSDLGVMATSKIDIIKRAASFTGFGALVSIEDNEEIARLTSEHYDAIVEEMLTEHGWKFARRVGPMQLTPETPEAPWSQLWRKPPGLLSLQFVQTVGGQRVDQEERDTDQGACCAVMGSFGGLFAVGVYRVPEDRWPADFAMAVQHRMESVFKAGIAEQWSEASERERLSASKQQKSRVRDQRSSTAGDASEWDLTASRGRRGAWDVRGYRMGRSGASDMAPVPPAPMPVPPAPDPGGDPVPFDFADFYNNLPSG